MKFILTVPSLLLAVSLICTQTTHAHGLGITHTQKTDQYTVELEQEEPEIVAGTSIPYTIRLRDQQGELTDFDEVQIRFVDSENRSIVSVRSKPDFRTGTTSLSLPIPLPGDVSVSTNFMLEEKSIAKATFALVVIPPPSQLNPWLIILPLIGLVVGSASTLGIIAFKKKRDLKKSSVKNSSPRQKRLK